MGTNSNKTANQKIRQHLQIWIPTFSNFLAVPQNISKRSWFLELAQGPWSWVVRPHRLGCSPLAGCPGRWRRSGISWLGSPCCGRSTWSSHHPPEAGWWDVESVQKSFLQTQTNLWHQETASPQHIMIAPPKKKNKHYSQLVFTIAIPVWNKIHHNTSIPQQHSSTHPPSPPIPHPPTHGHHGTVSMPRVSGVTSSSSRSCPPSPLRIPACTAAP